MPSLETSGLLLGTALLLGFTPGPDNVFVLSQAVAHGRKAGLLVVLGLCVGLTVHTTAVALGLATLFATSALAFTITKVAGAAYLLHLAWRTYRSSSRQAAVGEGAPDASALFRRGIVMNLTNPKVALFFLALLPQFVLPGSGPVALQLAWFGLLFIVATLLAFGAIVWGAAFIGERLGRSARAQRTLNGATAVVFAGLAVRLITAER